MVFPQQPLFDDELEYRNRFMLKHDYSCRLKKEKKKDPIARHI
jgi:hypothetical protein